MEYLHETFNLRCENLNLQYENFNLQYENFNLQYENFNLRCENLNLQYENFNLRCEYLCKSGLAVHLKYDTFAVVFFHAKYLSYAHHSAAA